MNKKEAIKALNLLFSDSTNENYPFTEEFALAVKVGIEALEMQIPKEVKIEDYCPANCPTCDVNLSESLGDGYYNYYTHLDRCPKCGQAIKWEESK